MEKNNDLFDKATGGEKRRRRKSNRRWFIWGLSAIVVLWISYMPVQLHRPFCETESVKLPNEVYGPKLSKIYRETLKNYFSGSNTLYLEINDMVLVPFIENGDEANPVDPLGRVLLLLIDPLDFIWGQTNAKIASWSVQRYVNAHPDSEIAKLDRAYSEAVFGDNPKKLDRLQKSELKCDLYQAITDPNLK
ncbi:hypothetical protein L2D14_01570 [Thalassospiraceae bacterium LMO-JJ14]|nr:hypothetical protein L2D14_01570 [Thalassospiraceae bacterium LMO-JJ14]